MQFPEIHLGEIIEAELKRIGITKAEFGRRINVSRQNVSSLIRKANLHTDTLKRVSIELNRNLFEEFVPIEFPKIEAVHYDSIRVRPMAMTIEMADPEDIKAFLEWLKERKAPS